MSGTANRWKLGLFVVLAAGGLFGAVFWLGAGQYRKAKITGVTYFHESVQGLDVGSDVKFRGVTVGRVSAIAFANNTTPQVEIEAVEERLDELGLSVEPDGSRPVTMDLRAQLVSAGITGLKFVQLDLAGAAEPPPPLSFEPPDRFDVYIPSRPSTMKGIEDAVSQALEGLPEFADEVTGLLERLNALVESVRGADLPAGAKGLMQSGGELIDSVSSVIGTLDRAMTELDPQGLKGSVEKVLGELERTLATTQELLRSISNRDGPLHDTVARIDALLGTVERTIVEARVAETTLELRRTSDEMTRTLAALREAAVEVRLLVDDLRHDPAALLHGRSYDARPPSKEDDE